MKKIIFALSAVILLATACSKDDDLKRNQTILGMGGDEYTSNAIDQWIYENYTQPYNMEIKYRWDQSELDLNRTLVPVKEDVVIPLMTAIKRIWIAPYESLAGSSFIKQLSPKKFVLVGSPKYNNNSITLGEAEGGRKIVMYRLNWFVVTNASIIREILKTVHHEFTHTMTQTITYPVEYKYITPSGYNASWQNVTEAAALKLGFVSSYACAAPDEDFAEMVSRIAVYGRPWFEQKVADAAKIYADPLQNVGMLYNPAVALRNKEAIVVKYLREIWGVNLYDLSVAPSGGTVPQQDKGLVTLVQEAITAVTQPQ